MSSPRSNWLSEAITADALKRWRSVAYRTLFAIGVFSLFVNILMLTLPLYLFQLSDRVLTSRSMDTLLMLSMVARHAVTPSGEPAARLSSQTSRASA